MGPIDGSEDGAELKGGAKLGIRYGTLLTLGINEGCSLDTFVGKVLGTCVKVVSLDVASDGEELATNGD
eukprot:7138294-Ditylum_brightwellii.AAC.1